MQTYLVGGAVRDELLGLPVKDRDWLVVGATPECLMEKGYRPVGQEFPVFLHPVSHEEYALARQERKSGVGYRGFEVSFSPQVTLDEDLARRDLTINAMAVDQHGALHDPHHGQEDLQQRLLRHVSPAFCEDPLRVLRVARFAAKLAPLGFQIAPQTAELMRTMAHSGELQSLTPERVWRETMRALETPAPWVFFQVLRDVEALAVLFPEVDALFGVPQPEKWHPEIDSGVHSLMVLQQACLLSDQLGTRFASLVHDLGKALTDPADWPKHPGHEQKGLAPVKALCNRLKCPKEVTDFALLATQWHGQIHQAQTLRPNTALALLLKVDAFRKPERFEQLLKVCEADARGRQGFEQAVYAQAAYWRGALNRLKSIELKKLVHPEQSGVEISNVLAAERLARLKEWRDDWTEQ
jgi:tRNA nucleotidyltransferase (CCA-adding enzyme)